MLNIEAMRGLLKQVVSHTVLRSDESPILLLGLTGAGKSTLGNYLLGYNMQRGEGGEAIPLDSTVPMESVH